MSRRLPHHGHGHGVFPIMAMAMASSQSWPWPAGWINENTCQPAPLTRAKKKLKKIRPFFWNVFFYKKNKHFSNIFAKFQKKIVNFFWSENFRYKVSGAESCGDRRRIQFCVDLAYPHAQNVAKSSGNFFL